MDGGHETGGVVEVGEGSLVEAAIENEVLVYFIQRDAFVDKYDELPAVVHPLYYAAAGRCSLLWGCSCLVAHIEKHFQQKEHQPICVAVANELLRIADNVFALSHCGWSKRLYF
jgi:hypothetical protein